MSREIGSRNILLALLSDSMWVDIPYSLLLARIYGVGGELTKNHIVAAFGITRYSEDNYWSEDVGYEVGLLQTAGFINRDSDIIKRTKDANVCREAFDTVSYDIDYDVKEVILRICKESNPNTTEQPTRLSAEQIAGKIVDLVIKDLSGRSGLENVWEEIDEGIQDEIKKEWAAVIEKTLIACYEGDSNGIQSQG